MAKKVTSKTPTPTEADVAKIRTVYNPEGVELEMLKRVYHRFEQMKDSPDRKMAEREWDRGRKQWEAMRIDRGEGEWQSNHQVPMTTAVVESALSEVIDQSPKPLILPRGSEDIPKVTVMSHLFDYTWEVSDSDLEFEDIIHDAFIEGTGIGQEYFYADMRRIKTSRKGESKTEWNEEDMLDYNDCFLESVKNEDFFVDENARGFRGPFAARDCIRRYIMNIADFRQFFKGPVWDPLDNAKYVRPGGDTNYYEWYKPPQGVDHGDMVEVLWYWARKPDDWMIIVANEILVVLGPNPNKHKELPFSRAIDVKRTHKFYGKGEPALLESIQDEVNTLRRMVLDRNHLDIDKMFIGSNKLGMQEEDLVARPHGFIPVDDPNSVKAVEYGDVPQSVSLSKQWLEDDSTIVTGINPRAQALPTTGTATEAAILKESTLKRIRLKVRRIEREFLARIAKLRVSNILQYYTQPKMQLIIGEQGSQDFKNQIQDLENKGILVSQQNATGGTDYYKKTYREIRLKDQALVPNAKGQIQQQPANGYTFFEADPKYFLPERGGYDIMYEAGSTLPISKPLMQSKAAELYDRLIQLALGVPNTYDPVKLGDMIIKVNDYNPDDLKTDKTATPEDDSQARLQMLINLAQTENNLMMHGKDVPPTPYASPQHTLIHVQFTSSPTFSALKKDDPIVKIFIDHITGEIAAQTDRQNGSMTLPAGGGTPDPNVPPGPGGAVATPTPAATQNGGNKALTDIQPAQIQGGGQVPAAV